MNNYETDVEEQVSSFMNMWKERADETIAVFNQSHDIYIEEETD